MKYENYIFDLYGTLVDIHTDEEKMELWEKLTQFYGYYGAAYTPQELKNAYAHLTGQKEETLRQKMGTDAALKKDDAHEAHPEIEIEEVFLALFQEKGVQADMELAVHAGQFFRILSTEYIRLYDGAKELLAALRERGKKVYLLSNAQRIFTAYELRLLGLEPYFDDIFLSSACKVKKPDPRFFHLLLEKHHILPEESIMIGNDAVSDIRGAKEVGLHTFYIHSNISPDISQRPDADHVLMQMDLLKVRQILISD